MSILFRRLTIIVGLIAFTVFIGTLGFVFVSGYSWFDAIYMSLITITTVGYFEVQPLGPAGRIFNSLFLVMGVSTMFLAIGVITQTVFELEFNKYFSQRRAKRMIGQLRNHYIVCGYGRVGRNAAAELQKAGVPLIIVDTDDSRIERATRAGSIAVAGDATLDSTLRDVGIERARGLIAALSSDADNLFLVLSAKTLNASLQISARVLEEESEHKMRRAGADTVLAPYAITGSRLAQAILRPHVLQFLDFANIGLDVGIEQVRVHDGALCVSKSLKELQIRRDIGVIVLAIRRSSGEMMFNPDADAVVNAGDHLIAMGGTDALHRLEHMVERAG